MFKLYKIFRRTYRKWLKLIQTSKFLKLVSKLKSRKKPIMFLNLLQSFLDVTDESSYERIVKEVSDVVQENGLNVLVNNAGANPRSGTLNMVTSDAIIESFKINTLAPIMLTKVNFNYFSKSMFSNQIRLHFRHLLLCYEKEQNMKRLQLLMLVRFLVQLHKT